MYILGIKIENSACMCGEREGWGRERVAEGNQLVVHFSPKLTFNCRFLSLTRAPGFSGFDETSNSVSYGKKEEHYILVLLQ